METQGKSLADTWFEVRVIYVRLSSCLLRSAPDCFTIVFPSRSMSTVLEVNGIRIPASEQTYRKLRRDRVDTESAEATYISTDNLRTNDGLPFELHHRGELLVTGNFERSVQENHKARKKLWAMDCSSAISAGSSCVLSSKAEVLSGLNAPFLEVYVAGRSLGRPIVLTKMVHLLPRKKCTRCVSLDAIPEDDDYGSGNSGSSLKSQYPCVEREKLENRFFSEVEEFNGRHDIETFHCDEAFYNEGGGGGGGELSWFKEGVRVGMGIGLGMCLGIGIGVGLIIRTYQATARPFRRRPL